MIGMLSKEIAVDKIVAILKDFKRMQDSIFEMNRAEFVQGLGPGATIPTYIKLSPKNDELLNNEIISTRNKFQDVINPLLKELYDDITTAPSAEAVNAITMLNMRSTVSPLEVDMMMEKYGRNDLAYSTIKDIAYHHDIKGYKDNKTVKQYEKLTDLLGKLNSWTTVSITNDKLTDGKILAYKAEVELAFDPDATKDDVLDKFVEIVNADAAATANGESIADSSVGGE